MNPTASPSSPVEDSDGPECPVCLQPYDSTAVVPRVLPCGHSICHVCIPLLPPPLSSAPNSLRCPSCTQLVPFDRQLGPTSLPKNLDLLHFVPSSVGDGSKRERPNTGTEFSKRDFDKFDSVLPLSWSKQNLFSNFWKNYVLPEKLVILEEKGDENHEIAYGMFASSTGSPWFCKEKQIVSVFKLKAESFGEEKSEWFRPSYISRMMNTIEKLGDKARNELHFLLEASSIIKHGICKIHGLRMDIKDEQNSNLYLVSEKFDLKCDFSKIEEVDKDKESIFQIGILCMELCEIMTNLHLNGISLGCLGFDCFYFDKFGHVMLDLNRVLVLCRRLKEVNKGDFTSLSQTETLLLPPELLHILQKGPCIEDLGPDGLTGYSSDVWCLACLIITILIGDNKTISELIGNSNTEFYEDWKRKVMEKLKHLIIGTKFESLIEIIESCLSYEPKNRPRVVDLFKKFQQLILKISIADVVLCDSLKAKEEGESCCLLLATFYEIKDKKEDLEKDLNSSGTEIGISDTSEKNGSLKETGTSDLTTGTLKGHRDCVSELAIGGDFLFSSSYDKTINAWTLKDFSHVQTLRGHEHKVMAMLVITVKSESFIITGDSGSGIFMWKISTILEGSEPFKNWYEQNDWRYSGIHSFAFSGTGFLYTGSGDKSIKAWSLEDEKLVSTMTGHKSTVSCLQVQNGILYSGSWDGTIRLWWISDHTNFCILAQNNDLNHNANLSTPVLSLSLGEDNSIVSSHENGYLKIWRNETLVQSEKIKNSAIYALHLDRNWIFTGGLDKTVHIQEVLKNETELEIRDVASIKCEAIITSLLYSQGKLFVGLTNKEIKVYHMDSLEVTT